MLEWGPGVLAAARATPHCDGGSARQHARRCPPLMEFRMVSPPHCAHRTPGPWGRHGRGMGPLTPWLHLSGSMGTPGLQSLHTELCFLEFSTGPERGLGGEHPQEGDPEPEAAPLRPRPLSPRPP